MTINWTGKGDILWEERENCTIGKTYDGFFVVIEHNNWGYEASIESPYSNREINRRSMWLATIKKQCEYAINAERKRQ